MFRAYFLTVLTASFLFGQNRAPHDPVSSGQSLVNRYCLGCHNDKVKTAGFSVQNLRTEAVAPNADAWEKVLRKVRTGEMPPPKLPRPTPEAARSFTRWLADELDRGAAANPNPGRPTIQRLNRAEYSNAIRDLLALELDHAAGLPADDSGYGFDNIGDVLTVSPLLMEKYMSTARRVSRLAIGTVKAKPAIERYTATPARTADTGKLPLNARTGMSLTHFFPVDAEYSILVRLRGTPPPNAPAPKLDVRVDNQRVKLYDAVINPAEEAQDTRNFEIRLPIKAGMHSISAALLNEYVKLENPPVLRLTAGTQPPPPLSVDYVQIGGPFNPQGPGETESRKRIFVCRPEPGKAEEPCAEKILSTIARRAYRRPVTETDMAPLMRLFAEGRQDSGSFEGGIETALRAILVSPNFLFRASQSPKGSKPGSIYRISDLELATRLSFFLWSSIPDDELLSLAEQGKLRPALEQQVRRMLADPKAKALVDNFAGQWLHLRNVAGWTPDPDKFPQFDSALRYAFQRETELFFEHIIREDRSVLDFLSADYSFVNERLAKHYGIPGVRGSWFRKVALNEKERGGVVTHGSILTVTSYPTRTSPVIRGKWILENILGAPPPPPPPNVPDLEDSAAISAKDLRQALEKHRANAACASCHAQLDPLGFALENYDAIGKFRSSEGGVEIDASGALPGGSTFSGPAGLKSVLMERSDQFVECFTEKLLTYALGRGLEYYDRPAIRQIRREAARNNYRFSAVTLAVINSVPFQMRRTPEK